MSTVESTVALQEACQWHDALMDAEFKGRRDKESAIRFRLSKKSGVPISYLFRIAHKRREMRSLDAEVYRLLALAHRKYVLACEQLEEAADEMRVERMRLKEQEKNEDAQGHRDMAQGVVEAAEAATALNGERPRGLGANRP